MKEVSKEVFYKIKEHFSDHIIENKPVNTEHSQENMVIFPIKIDLKGDTDEIKPFLKAEKINNEIKFFVRDPIFKV